MEVNGRKRKSLPFFFLYPFPEFSNVGDLWDRRKFYDVRSVFPEIGIFRSSWDRFQFLEKIKFCGVIEFDRKKTSIFWKRCKQLGKLGNCGSAQEKFGRSYKDPLRAGADKISILWKRALNAYFAFSSNSCYTIYRRLGEDYI